MSAWIWVVIAVAIVVVLAIAVWAAVSRRRTHLLQDRFGPEYERTVDSTGSRRAAEAELDARQERRDQLDIRPLPDSARVRYLEEWQQVQALFVDDPDGALARADVLIQSAMSDRGYPVEDFEQRAADISVDHPEVVENYREGHRLATQGGHEPESTEERRRAMRHYRLLFDDLVERARVSETADRDERAVR